MSRRFVPLAVCLTLLLAASACSSSQAATKGTTKTSTKTSTKTKRSTIAKVPTSVRRPVATTSPRAPIAGATSVPGTVVAIVPTSQVAAVRAKAPFERFGEVRFLITGSDGKDREFCALLADTEPLREQGLMGRSDLGGYDAMLFSWTEDSTTAFWMRTVPIWLSIAWFDVRGAHVGQLDMAPCGDSDSCTRYNAKAPYRWAMETLRGGLDQLGVKPGVALSVGGRCRAR